MARNKDGDFPPDKNIKDPKAKTAHASIRPDGSIAPTPKERMAKETE